MKTVLSILLLTCACIQTQAQINIIKTIAGVDTAGYCGDNGPASNAALNNCSQIYLDKSHNIFIADAYNHRLRKINLLSGIISTVAGNGIGDYNGDNIQATAAELFVPGAVFVDTNNNIYIGDGLNHRVRKITQSSGIITTIAGNGNLGNSGDGGPATDAEIYGPAGLTIDKNGNLYIADIQNHNVRKVSLNGIITTIAGTGTLGYTGDGGPATAATFNTPSYAIMDNYGNIIIDDGFNCAMRKIDATTGIVTTIAGNGTCGYSGDGGLAVNAEVSYPYGIFINKQNDIYFAEYGNGVIRKIDGATGIISTVVGRGISGFSGDGGPATAARLQPDGLVIDNNGVMYIADYGNNRIRMVYNDRLGTKPLTPKGEPTIWPNPLKDELHIADGAGRDLKIFNIFGQSVFGKLRLTNRQETINISSLISGIYIVRIEDENGVVQNFRVVKE